MTARPQPDAAVLALLRERVAADAAQRGLAVRPQDVDVEVVEDAHVPGAVVFVASWGVHPAENAVSGVLVDAATVVTGPAPALAVVLDRWGEAPPPADGAAAVVARLLDPLARNEVLRSPEDVAGVPALRPTASTVRPPRHENRALVFDWRTPYGIEEVTIDRDDRGSVRVGTRPGGAEEAR